MGLAWVVTDAGGVKYRYYMEDNVNTDVKPTVRQVLTVACPTCRALPGAMCRLPEGRTALHAERYDAWREEEGPKQGVKRTTRNQGVERVVRFKALDGTEHETHAAARRHNTDMALTRWLESWVTAHPWRANELAENVEQLAAALRKDWIISQRKEQGK